MNTFSSLKTVIRTRDFQTSCHFYKEILELEVMETWDELQDRGCIFRVAENALLEISQIDQEHEYFHKEFVQPATLKMDIQIATNDIDHWAKRLHAVWKCRGPVTRPWGSRYLYLKDPDGIQIIIYSNAH